MKMQSFDSTPVHSQLLYSCILVIAANNDYIGSC